MKVLLQPIAWSAKVCESDDAVFGDPYIANSTVTSDDEGVATIRGLSSDRYGREMRDAYAAALREAGMSGMHWSRRKDGKKVMVRVKL